jgi:protein-tyrosine-phosphatase
MAEALTKERIPAMWKGELEISSAGTYAWAGQPASSLAIEVMEEQGIDIGGHRARELSRELIEGAEVIIVMERAHRDEIERIAPAEVYKVVVMGELDPKRSNPDIMDPIGGDRGTYVRTRDEIDRLIFFTIDYIADKFKLTK